MPWGSPLGRLLVSLNIGFRSLKRCICSLLCGLVGAVFSSKLQSNLAPKVASATVPLGLPLSSLPLLLKALVAHNEEALMEVPGITPAILAAGIKGMKQGYVVAFRNVWIIAAAVAAGGLICMCNARN